MRTARRWATERNSRGPSDGAGAALDIGELISPLRLDVLVRASLFETWRGDWVNLRNDPERSLAIAESHPYRTWFDRVAAEKVASGVTSETDRNEAFVWRVKRTHSLLDGYINEGFDERYPITVKVHRGGTIATNKQLTQRYYPVDGCHRLALLWVDGIRTLQPWHYRLLTVESEPRDNTSLLLPALDLDAQDYCRFVGLGYRAPETTTVADLLAAVPPGDIRRGELESVLSIDGYAS